MTSEVDEIEIDLATDKLVEIEEKIANCKLKAEQSFQHNRKNQSLNVGVHKKRNVCSLSLLVLVYRRENDVTSLNDFVEKGPCLLNDLTGILLRFRRFKIGIAGDISKMFLRVLLFPDDCKYHRFLWRTNEDQLPDTYQFNCIIFGNPASPFLASYVIKRIIKDYGTNKPKACDL